jgi:hypothetical protein
MLWQALPDGAISLLSDATLELGSGDVCGKPCFSPYARWTAGGFLQTVCVRLRAKTHDLYAPELWAEISLCFEERAPQGRSPHLP